MDSRSADVSASPERSGSSLSRDQLIEELRGIVGSSGVLVDDAVTSRYPGYFMKTVQSRLLVRPSSTEEVSAVLRLCNEVGQSVVTQGGMSGWVRATETTPDDLILSMEKMNAVEEIDTVNRTVSLQSGVILESLQVLLEDHGLIFPLDLGGRGSCQVGGNASTNAGGIRVIRYGMMRQLVLGVEAVMADGTVISSMNKMLKNNSGYDLKHLFLGSEGTLGVITRLVLRLYEKPLSENSAMVALEGFDQVAGFLRFIDRALGGNLSAFEVLDQQFYQLNTGPGRHSPPLPNHYPYYVIVESLGFAIEKDAELFEQALTNALEGGLIGDAVLPTSSSDRDAIWQIREDLEHVVKDLQPFQAFDVSMPIGEMEAYMDAVRQRIVAQWPDGKLCFLGHVGDGNLHIAVGCGTQGEGVCRSVEHCVYDPLQAIGGSVSAEHGIGLEKKDFLPISRSTAEIKLMKLLKLTLDPRNILNPGKVLDAG